MFDNQNIAKRIKQARIDKNLTQMNLADAMGVSYQAVSNWERGNSLPDISKLEDLCTVLDMTVSQLLGMEETADLVDKAVEGAPMTVEELKQVAPMLPPKTVKEHVESERKRKKFRLDAIADLAPFLDEEYLDELIGNADISDLEGLEEVAPFLSDKTMEKLVERSESLDGIEDVLCFLSNEALDKLIRRSWQEKNMDVIEEAAVFASEKTLDALVDDYIREGGGEDLEDIFPFLSQSTLKKLAKHLMQSQDLDALEDLMPFL